MSTTAATPHPTPRPSLLARERIIAKPGFNRWLMPPCALAIHLCIGMAYGFSVFWLPLSRAIGVQQPLPCAADMSVFQALVVTNCDWRVSDLGWIYTLFFVVLGSSAATWGSWLERVGPRKTGVVAAVCWSGGLAVAAIGVMVHQLWLMWIGAGVIGGIGLGLGYISPVSTLIKWFPDRRGMATGMAIMGFGGGAMIGAPLAATLMNTFRSPDSVGVWQTILVLASVYFLFMMAGAFGYRLPPPGWKLEGWTPPTASAKRIVTSGYVHLRNAHRTPQFWLVWAVLCLNVSAGIGVIGMASPMLQEIFGGSLIGVPAGFTDLNDEQRQSVAVIAAGFTGLLSLFNIGGRFFWASLSDRIGRRATYSTFFLLGIALYAAAPWAARSGEKGLFVAFLCVIVSMYGGGFATIPAYLADLFGTQFVGAIHGRLLTAWSTAGIIGPVLVNYLREAQIAAGVPRAFVYDVTLYILAGLLAVGFIANLLVRPVSAKWITKDEDAQPIQAAVRPEDTGAAGSMGIGPWRLNPVSMGAWVAVGLPLAWGMWITLSSAFVLFG